MATSLLLLMALLVASCVEYPKRIKLLTDNEKDRLIEIALDTPEVSKWLKNGSIYKAEVGWIAIVWKNSEAGEWHVLDYEEVANGSPPQYIPESATIYPSVLIRVGEPEQVHVHVAFDQETEQVVLVELLPVIDLVDPSLNHKPSDITRFCGPPSIRM